MPAIGGGPAGSAATTFLARGGVRVAVVERQAFPRFKVRASLAPTSIALCERIGVLSALCTGRFRAAPFRSYEHAMRRGARRFEQFIEGPRQFAICKQTIAIPFEDLRFEEGSNIFVSY